MEFLESIKATLDCGRISISKNGQARYAVNSINDLIFKVVPFFTDHRLDGKKRLDFALWKEAVEIFQRNQKNRININKGERTFHKIPWNPSDLIRLKKIHEAMRLYKSKVPVWKWLEVVDVVK